MATTAAKASRWRPAEINAAGGIKGRKVRVLMEDDKSNIQETSNKVLQLIDRDKVIAILGEVASWKFTNSSTASGAEVPL